MRFDPQLEGGEEAERKPLYQRLAWMAAIWLASIAVLSVVAYGIRFWIV